MGPGTEGTRGRGGYQAAKRQVEKPKCRQKGLQIIQKTYRQTMVLRDL